MKKLSVLLISLLVLGISGTALAQDFGFEEEESQETVEEAVESTASDDAGSVTDIVEEESVETVEEAVESTAADGDGFDPLGDFDVSEFEEDFDGFEAIGAAELDDGVTGSALPSKPQGGTSGVQIVNLANDAATVQAVYYAENGQKFTLPPQKLDNFGSSYTYYAEPKNEQSFSGAGILSSNKSIAAIVNAVFADKKGAAYEGSAASTRVLLPLIVRGYAGVVSIIGIQNTNESAATKIQIEFVPQDGSSFTKEYTVQAGASKIVDLADMTDFNSEEWLGMAIVKPADGSTKVVASVMNYSEKYVYSYAGTSETSDTNYLPLIRSGFAGNLTGISVVDANTANDGDSTITVEYSGKIYVNGTPSDYTCTVQAVLPDNKSIVFYNSGSTNFTKIFGGSGSATVTAGTCKTSNHANFDAAGGVFLGSAKVTAAGTNVAIASVVNDQSLSGNSSGAYTGFLPSQAGSKVVSPLARNGFAGTTSGTQIQNISTSEITVEATYSTNTLSGNSSTPPSKQVTLASGQSTTFYLPQDWGAGSGETNWLGSVSVNVSQGNGQIVGITNDAPTGDASLFSTILAK